MRAVSACPAVTKGGMRSASLKHPALAVVLSRDSGFSAIPPQAIALYFVARFRLFGDSASSHRALG